MKIYTFKPGMLRGRLPQKILLIMRLVIIIMVTCLMQVSAAGFAQRLTYAKKNTTLAQVFTEIKKQTGYNVLYSDQKVDGRRKLSVNFQDTALEDVLDVLLEGQPLGFEIDQKTILIKEKMPSFLDKVAGYFAAIDVRGRVVDSETGEGLAGATVKVKGTNKQTSTNGNGEFYLENVGENAVLEISYIGYAIKEIAATAELGNIGLTSALSELQEVTINKGYYTEKKALSTGSVSSVNARVIEQQPVNNPLLALQGRVPGLFIEQTSGTIGSKINVNIRGKNSLQNGIDPLYIVDGVPFSSQSLSGSNSALMYNTLGVSPFYSISTTDIESIEVLKDADATAIYGSRGANGVILITTKRGRPGKARISMNVSSGVSKVPHFLNLMNSDEYLQMRHQAFKNDKRTVSSFHYDLNGTWDSTRYTNWQKELIGGSAQNTLAQASLSGGSQFTTYLFSGSYQKETVVFPGKNSARKGSFLVSVANESPNEKFKSRFSTNYVINSNNINGSDMTQPALTLSPVAPKLYNEDGSLNWENNTWDNPLATIIYRRFELASNNLISNLSLGYEIIPRLEIKADFGLNHLQRNEKSEDPSTAYNPINGLTPANSQVFASNGSNSTWIIEPQLSWRTPDRTFGNFSIIIGGTLQSQQSRSLSHKYEGFASNTLIDDLGSAAIVSNEASLNSSYRYSALYARLNYAFKEKYIINLTGRRDGSSRFGPGRQFANLGAIGAAWVFTNEEFAKNSKFLSYGKLRSSFGLTGNDQIGDYRYLDTYRAYQPYDGVGGLVPTRLFNPDYAWETTRKYEVALELGFLKDRITLTGAYYNNRSSNQLLDYRVGSTTGFNGILKNFPAKIENSGIEVEINTLNIKPSNGFSWSTNFNISMPRNKLIEFRGIESSSYASTYVVGKSLSIQKVYNNTGIDPATGIYTFEDMNQDGQVTSADRLIPVEINTKFFGGINNSFSYSGFKLDVFFQFVNKNAPSVLRAFLAAGRQPYNQPKFIIGNTWAGQGDEAKFQRYTTNNSNVIEAFERYNGSQHSLVDASFIRLKNISLSYKLPKKWTGTFEPTFFAQGQNLFTITGYDGLDPETGPGFSLPTLRTIVFGASISL